MNRTEHWENVYQNKPADRVGWYKPRLQSSLEWIGGLGLESDAPLIDVGGGASTFVDDLLDNGLRAVTVLDMSASALEQSKSRLGNRANLVKWLVGDVTSVELPRDHFELWHDRAAFHFLATRNEQERYRDRLLAALKPGGRLVIGTFAPEAPPTCSNLPVQRYDSVLLAETLGDELELLRHHKEMHVTPSGVEQMYLYCLFRLCSQCHE